MGMRLSSWCRRWISPCSSGRESCWRASRHSPRGTRRRSHRSTPPPPTPGPPDTLLAGRDKSACIPSRPLRTQKKTSSYQMRRLKMSNNRKTQNRSRHCTWDQEVLCPLWCSSYDNHRNVLFITVEVIKEVKLRSYIIGRTCSRTWSVSK